MADELNTSSIDIQKMLIGIAGLLGIAFLMLCLGVSVLIFKDRSCIRQLERDFNRVVVGTSRSEVESIMGNREPLVIEGIRDENAPITLMYSCDPLGMQYIFRFDKQDKLFKKENYPF